MNIHKFTDTIYRIQSVDYHQKNIYNLYGGKAISYNSYIFLDKSICLINLPPPLFMNLFIKKVKELANGQFIQSLILNRIDPIIMSALSIFLINFPQIQLLVNRKSFETITTFKPSYKNLYYDIVDSNYSLNTGNNILLFKQTPLLRWPDSMAIYLQYDKIVFTGDLFSQYTADQIDNYEVLYEQQLYFVSNLFTHVPNQLKQYLTWFESMKFQQILPDYGSQTVGEENVHSSAQLYYKFTGSIQKQPKFIALYETMYGTTEKAVDLVAKVLKSHGIEVVMLNMKYNLLDKLALNAQDCVGIILATPTLNGDAMPGVVEGVSFLKQLGIMKGKIGFVLGAYGWDGGMAQRRLQKDLEEMSVQVLGKIVWKYNFGDEIYAQLTEAGEVVSKKVLQIININE
ncbi:A-type flavoprotein [Spironucleus salmonicida]|uniref:A-type flavoprotein n=1 Tax=Spironucleus salmonicida TaxID=348837 RepID=V6LTB7_9EUKA|nr:A-type flavoprotein [Spironucleus salmonicida]|eukprot:EST44034.1 A-type flavoprotein [Spironucleus salmonicida]